VIEVRDGEIGLFADSPHRATPKLTVTIDADVAGNALNTVYHCFAFHHGDGTNWAVWHT
jgi:hypothetical protein